MFGVIGLYFDGLMFGMVSNDAVFLKVDESNKNKFLEADSAPLKLFKKNAEVPSFYELPVEVLENAELFVEWAKESFAI